MKSKVTQMASQLCSTAKSREGVWLHCHTPSPSHTLSTLLLVKKTLQHDIAQVPNLMIVEITVVYYSLYAIHARGDIS